MTVRYPRTTLVMGEPLPRRKSSELIAVVRHGPQQLSVACTCREADQSEGVCRHTDRVLSTMKPWYRQRCRVRRMRDEQGLEAQA